MATKASTNYDALKPDSMCLAVVLYNPTHKQIENLEHFSNFKKVVIIDNSKKDNFDLVKNYVLAGKLKYINNPENAGLSVAYNQALKVARKLKIRYLMLADQDSIFDAKVIAKLSQEVKTLKLDLDEFAVLGLSWYTDVNLAPKNTIIDEQLVVFSSGSVINVDLVDKIGNFDERYYIDSVDVEICLRAIISGYKTGKILNLGFKHDIGNPKVINSRIFHKDLTLYGHAPIRRYYQTRNALLIKKDFASADNARVRMFVKEVEEIWIKDQLKTIMYEKNKLQKIYYSFRGWLDFKLNRFGKF